MTEIKENMVNLSEKEIFENLRKKVEENLEKRFKHVAYLTKIRDFFEYNKETKNNYSLMGFRNSNKNKYSKEKIMRKKKIIKMI